MSLLFGQPKREGNEPVTHDYTTRTWGHDFSFDLKTEDGKELSITGWGHGIRCGDYIILPHRQSGSTRYRFTKLKYFLDPPDMWHGTAVFTPRPAYCEDCGSKLSERAHPANNCNLELHLHKEL